MAAVLACGDGVAVSHGDAAALLGIARRWPGPIHVSVPYPRNHRAHGIRTHRRSTFDANDITKRLEIPVTTPAVTIVDIAASQSERRLERAINEADQKEILRFDALRNQLPRMSPRPGLARVNRLITRWTFRLTRSELERLFLRIARRAGLPVPETLVKVNGFEVDFWFPELGLVVEADSLTYHRTPAKQLADRRRDQAHIASGLVPLRFTHWQIAREPREVERILRKLTAQRRALAA